MFKEYDDLIKQMEFEMQRRSSEAMRRLLELPSNSQDFWLPRADVYETDDDLVVRIDIAGVKKESLNVSLSADRRILTLKGVRRERDIDPRQKIRYYQLEVYFGAFERDVLLPSDIAIDSERLSASYKDGFLVVTLPKASSSNITRVVKITSDEED